MAFWGGPGILGANGLPLPGPECRSCFKDGISFAPGEAPQGFQTQEFSFLEATDSFFDAAITFEDNEVSGDGRTAVVVVFRCAASKFAGRKSKILQRMQ
jgi:hypothetical protein